MPYFPSDGRQLSGVFSPQATSYKLHRRKGFAGTLNTTSEVQYMLTPCVVGQVAGTTVKILGGQRTSLFLQSTSLTAIPPSTLSYMPIRRALFQPKNEVTFELQEGASSLAYPWHNILLLCSERTSHSGYTRAMKELKAWAKNCATCQAGEGSMCALKNQWGSQLRRQATHGAIRA